MAVCRTVTAGSPSACLNAASRLPSSGSTCAKAFTALARTPALSWFKALFNAGSAGLATGPSFAKAAKAAAWVAACFTSNTPTRLVTALPGSLRNPPSDSTTARRNSDPAPSSMPASRLAKAVSSLPSLPIARTALSRIAASSSSRLSTSSVVAPRALGPRRASASIAACLMSSRLAAKSGIVLAPSWSALM